MSNNCNMCDYYNLFSTLCSESNITKEPKDTCPRFKNHNSVKKIKTLISPDWQQSIINSLKETNLIGLDDFVGKTTLAAKIAIDQALIKESDKKIILISLNRNNTKILFDKIHNFYSECGTLIKYTRDVSAPRYEIKFTNDASIIGVSKNRLRLRGMQSDSIIIDDANSITSTTFIDEILPLSLCYAKSKLTCLYNPYMIYKNNIIEYIKKNMIYSFHSKENN